MSSISIASFFALTAYLVCILGDTFKRNVLILMGIMFMFDGLAVGTIAFIVQIKLPIAVGILFGTVLKIIIFLLYQKHFRDESR
tara:strand:- start:61 stop:312 length:252 start_codon:yes stop_codon:yes gene_type:complete